MDDRQKPFETFQVPDPVRIRKAIRFIRKNSRDISSLAVLECGIAQGGVADTLKEEGAQCCGVDIHPRTLEGVKTFQRDLNEGFPDFGMKFDVIFAGEVMEHLYDDAGFIVRCRRLLNPGGLLIITVPNLLFSANRVLMMFGRMPLFAYLPFHYHIYNKSELKRLMEDNGFDVVGFTSSHILFSSRRNIFGRVFEWLGDVFPSFGAHLIVCGKRSPDTVL